MLAYLKMIFQRSKVVSEAMFPTDKGYFLVLGSGLRFQFRALVVPELSDEKVKNDDNHRSSVF